MCVINGVYNKLFLFELECMMPLWLFNRLWINVNGIFMVKSASVRDIEVFACKGHPAVGWEPECCNQKYISEK